MKNYILVILSVSLFSCATYNPMPKNKGVFKSVYSTGVKSDEAYRKAMVFLSKQVNDVSQATKLKDDKNKQIVLKITFQCNELDVGGYGAPLSQFDIDLAFKDLKHKIEINYIGTTAPNGLGANLVRIDDKFSGHLQSCMRRMSDAIVYSITKKEANW